MDSEDHDIAAMYAAYKAMSSIPAHTNRRGAALWWLHQRLSTELKHELDAVSIDAIGTAARMAQEASDGTRAAAEAARKAPQ